jgi:MFS family permease
VTPSPTGSLADPAAPQASAATPDARWRALAVIAIAALLGMSTWFSGTAVVGALRTQWRLEAAGASLLTIAVQLGFVTGAMGAALVNLLDIVPPRRVFVAACIGAALVNGALPWAPGAGAGIALRFATGLFIAGVYPTALKVMATWFVRDRGLALGVMVGALALGSAAPHLVNGLGGLDWRGVILSTSALTLLGAVLWATLVHEGPNPFPRARFDPRQAGRVLRDRGVRLACIGYFGHMWELYAMWTWFLVFFADSLTRTGVTEPQRLASLAAFAVIGAGFLGCWWAGVLADRVGRAPVAAWAMVISGACAGTIGLLHGAHPALLLAVGLVWGVSVVADSALFSTLVTELSDSAYVGTALALQLGIGFTLTVLTIWLVPLAREALGWRWAFALLVPGPVIGIAAMARLASRR